MIKLLKFGICSLSVSGLFLGLNQTSASAFTLDLFTDGNDTFPSTTIPYQNVEANPIFNTVSNSDTDTGLSDVAWGQRKLDITSTSSNIGSSSIQVFGSPVSRASISSDSGVTIDTAKFTWGFDANTDYEDITEGGTNNVFSLDILSIDLNGADIVFSVTDNTGDLGSATVEDITSTGIVSFAYNDIVTDNPNVRLGSIRKIEMEILNAPEDFDASFNFIESAYNPDFPSAEVPFKFSPSLGLIFCGGLFGMHKMKKRLTVLKA